MLAFRLLAFSSSEILYLQKKIIIRAFFTNPPLNIFIRMKNSTHIRIPYNNPSCFISFLIFSITSMYIAYFQKKILIFAFNFPVHPLIQVPNQLVGAPLGKTVDLHCISEAYPRPINYWEKEETPESKYCCPFLHSF